MSAGAGDGAGGQTGSPRRRRARALALVAVAAALAMAAAWWWGAGLPGAPWGRGPGEAPGRPGGQPPREPGVRTEDVRLVGRHKGQQQWELRARRIEMAGTGRQVSFAGVTDGVFYRAGAVFLRFEGEGGRWDEPGGQLVLDGRYTLSHPGGAVLESRDLVWEAGRQVLRTERPSTVRYRSAVLVAPRMEVDVAAGVVRLSGGVTLDDPGAGGLKVRAEGAEYLPESGEIRLLGSTQLEGAIRR